MENLTAQQKEVLEVAIELINTGKATIDNAFEMAFTLCMEHAEKMLQVTKDKRAGKKSTFAGAARYEAQYEKTFKAVQAIS